MSQHTKITLNKVDNFLDRLDASNFHDLRYAGEDLFRLLPLIDSFLVKHDRTDTARALRRSFDKLDRDL